MEDTKEGGRIALLAAFRTNYYRLQDRVSQVNSAETDGTVIARLGDDIDHFLRLAEEVSAMVTWITREGCLTADHRMPASFPKRSLPWSGPTSQRCRTMSGKCTGRQTTGPTMDTRPSSVPSTRVVVGVHRTGSTQDGSHGPTPSALCRTSPPSCALRGRGSSRRTPAAR